MSSIADDRVGTIKLWPPAAKLPPGWRECNSKVPKRDNPPHIPLRWIERFE